MEHCPTCNAKYTGKQICHRCKTDLRLIIDIENQGLELLKKAISCFESEDYQAMFVNARRSYLLCRTKAAAKIFACAALLTKQFKLAVSIIGRDGL